MAGVAAGLAAIALVRLRTPIAFTWYVLIGTTATFCVGWLASLFQGPPDAVLVREPVGATPHLPPRRTTAED